MEGQLITPTKYVIAWQDHNETQPRMFLCHRSAASAFRANWVSPADVGQRPIEFTSVGELLSFVANMRQEPDRVDYHFSGDGRFMIMLVTETTVITTKYVPVLG